MEPFIYFIVGIILGLTVYSQSLRWRSRTKEPYSNPGILYPLKIVIFYGMIKLRKSYAQRNKTKDSAGYGVASHNDQVLMDCPQKLSSNIKGIDAVFFSGSSMEGWGVVLAMERRPMKLTSVVVYVKVPGESVLVPLQHPDVINFRAESDEEVFCAGGLLIEVLKPTKSWRLRYEGKLRPSDNKDGISYDVNIDLNWTSSLPIFNYDSDLDLWSMAKSFAREPWSKQFFENLRTHHQTHYEQMGTLEGNISINKKTNYVKLPAFRDHSYGHKRDWTLMHRYYFHHVFLSDGSMGVLGLVCQPSTCTRLVLGHWWNSAGEGKAVTEIDLKLFEHGEKGTPPTDYSFTFKEGNRIHVVQVKFEFPSVHYLGWDWEAKFFEVFVNYTVDGVSGKGICEWEYNHSLGRPNEVTDKDPEWSKPLRQKYLTS